MALSIQEMGDRLDPGRVTKIMQEWPPEEHLNRLGNYTKQRMIYDGEHELVFNRKEQQRYPEYIMCNLAEVIPNSFADLLFGEDVTLEFDKDANTESVKWVNDFWKNEQMQVKCFEAAIDGGVDGESLFTVWMDEDVVRADPAPVINWIPKQNPDNKRDILYHTIAWERTLMTSEGKITFVKMRIYEKGLIRNELWLKKDGKLARALFPGSSEWELVMGDVGEVEEVGEVPDDFLLVVIPNFRLSRDYFGRGDLETIDSMQSALDARLTQNDAILSRFADPKTKGPKELVDEDGEYYPEEFDFVGMEDKDEDTFGYVTYDAKLDDSRALIEILADKILLLGGIDKALLGMETGGGPISGRALKFKLMRTLFKVARKRKYWKVAIEKILELAQLLDGREAIKVTVRFSDGLPQDNQELMEEVAQRRTLGLIGLKRSIERLDGVSSEEAESQLKEIEEEDGAENTAVSNALTNRPRPTFLQPPDLEEEV